ncbi:MAG: four-helix bundle copper-binding protein [Candidatus Obscuribacterales bacterium]|nr:four-helix bundle copper-binding protein [Candidatus Obscuribacterales bacterium]
MAIVASRNQAFFVNVTLVAGLLFSGASALADDAKPALSKKDAEAACCTEASGAMCGKCREECLKALSYCLSKGGKHTSAAHITTLLDCIDMCDISSRLTGRNSELSARICQICADVCNRCAKSCEDLNDPNLKACVEMCKQCAQSCCTK